MTVIIYLFTYSGCFFFFFFFFSGTLTIERCLESDQGKYECVAENAVGVAYSFAAFLYVKGE